MNAWIPPLAASALLAAGFGVSAATEEDRAYCERQQGGARLACLRELERAPSASTGPATGTPATAAPTAPATPAPAQPPAVSTTPASPAPGTPPAARPDAAARPAAARSTTAAAPYQVQGGTMVDPMTYKGFQTWRAAACDRCHGARQEGSVGPSLLDSLKRLSPEDFRAVVLNGRLDKGMPSFSTNAAVKDNVDALYGYLKGRSDGAITDPRVKPIGGG